MFKAWAFLGSAWQAPRFEMTAAWMPTCTLLPNWSNHVWTSVSLAKSTLCTWTWTLLAASCTMADTACGNSSTFPPHREWVTRPGGGCGCKGMESGSCTNECNACWPRKPEEPVKTTWGIEDFIFSLLWYFLEVGHVAEVDPMDHCTFVAPCSPCLRKQKKKTHWPSLSPVTNKRSRRSLIDRSEVVLRPTGTRVLRSVGTRVLRHSERKYGILEK